MKLSYISLIVSSSLLYESYLLEYRPVSLSEASLLEHLVRLIFSTTMFFRLNSALEESWETWEDLVLEELRDIFLYNSS